jgi:hypothetical protein
VACHTQHFFNIDPRVTTFNELQGTRNTCCLLRLLIAERSRRLRKVHAVLAIENGERGFRIDISPAAPDIPDDVYMAIRLRNYDPTIAGRIVFPSAYSVT